MSVRFLYLSWSAFAVEGDLPATGPCFQCYMGPRTEDDLKESECAMRLADGPIYCGGESTRIRDGDERWEWAERYSRKQA